VTSGRDCSPRKGYLCLESEGGIVHFRNIRLKELPGTPLDKEHVAIANRGYRSLYTGLNLSGWTSAGGENLSDHAKSAGWQAADWTLRHAGPDSDEITVELSETTGCLLDVRRDDDKSSALVQLRIGDSVVDVVTLSATESTRNLEHKPGKWNRIECDWSGDGLSLTINGLAVPAKAATGPGAGAVTLSIQAEGAATFANIFARKNTE